MDFLKIRPTFRTTHLESPLRNEKTLSYKKNKYALIRQYIIGYKKRCICTQKINDAIIYLHSHVFLLLIVYSYKTTEHLGETEKTIYCKEDPMSILFPRDLWTTPISEML